MLNERQKRIDELKLWADYHSSNGDEEKAGRYLQHISDLSEVLELTSFVTRLARALPADNPSKYQALEYLKSRALISPLR